MNKRLALIALGTFNLASAAPTHVNLQVPVTLTVPNPCAPSDAVTLSGTVHIVGQVKTDTSGTAAKVHVNVQNFGGTPEAGRLYRAQLNGKANLDFSSTVLPASATGSVNARLISQGSTDNFGLELNFDVTVDAAGNITVSPMALPEGSCNG
ncbi:hypothetical protein [Deinococcus sp. QL22]|uniref:hypothetical protein n=1 Tax=Deinococcus sp. QL22 TaxID=2939437 RepID=UPI002017D433|nr:hypothetical protein [Deinococcus sp. QL22]UQN09272.1 hypothetical protein M1R55_22110 [Deinococcus sp. QL22]